MIEWDDPVIFQKALFFFTCVVILSLILPMTIRADMVTINVPVATIRKEPSNDSPGVGMAYQGESLNIITKEGIWYKVKLPDHSEGWIWEGFIKAKKEGITITSAAKVNEASQTPMEEKQELILHLKVIKPVINIRSGPGVSYMWIGSVHANDILSAFELKNGWYRCKTPDGKEGWIISSACQMIPIHSESARLEIKRIIINSEEIPVKAGPDTAYPILGRLYIDQEAGVYLEEGEWLYIKKYDENLEGWIRGDNVYDPAKHIDIKTLKEEVLNISEKLSLFYDQKKKEVRSFQDAGWYPSFSVFLRDKDIVIKPLIDGVRLELTLSLRKISMDTLLPLPSETLPLSLTKSDRLFFMTLFQTIMENEVYQEVDIRLKGLKKERGSLRWVKAGSFMLRRSNIKGLDLDQVDPDTFWNLLKRKKD